MPPRQANRSHKLVVVGAGAWGTAVARNIAIKAKNATNLLTPLHIVVLHHEEQDNTVTDQINQQHRNQKFLPNVPLPDTIVATDDLQAAAHQATLVVFAVPHEYLHRGIFVKILAGCAPNCRAISLVKGLDVVHHRPELISHRMSRELMGMDVSVLSGNNIAAEVAQDEFCEATIGVNEPGAGNIWHSVFNSEKFRVNISNDPVGVELCGALKNIVSLGAGFCDGLQLGQNAKASIIRIGLEEMRRFSRLYFTKVRSATFMEACGVADVIASSYGGRTRKCAEAFARHHLQRSSSSNATSKTWAQLEEELLDGQKLPGMHRLQAVMQCLKHTDPSTQAKFPLFNAIYAVAFRGANPEEIVNLPERVSWRYKSKPWPLVSALSFEVKTVIVFGLLALPFLVSAAASAVTSR